MLVAEARERGLVSKGQEGPVRRRFPIRMSCTRYIAKSRYEQRESRL